MAAAQLTFDPPQAGGFDQIRARLLTGETGYVLVEEAFENVVERRSRRSSAECQLLALVDGRSAAVVVIDVLLEELRIAVERAKQTRVRFPIDEPRSSLSDDQIGVRDGHGRLRAGEHFGEVVLLPLQAAREEVVVVVEGIDRLRCSRGGRFQCAGWLADRISSSSGSRGRGRR